MYALTNVPAAIASLALWMLGVPVIFRAFAPLTSVALLAVLGVLILALTRGYRQRIVAPLSAWHLLGYLIAFIALDHVVNLVCFFKIELPILGPYVTVTSSWLVPLLISITAMQLAQIALNAGVLAIGLRCAGAPTPLAMALKIAVYSLPISLLIALPGADSWKAALIAQVLVQIVTLWRLGVEGELRHTPPQAATEAITIPPELEF